MNAESRGRSIVNFLCSRKGLLLLALVAIWLARLAGLGGPPLIDSTEGRYAEISREMIATDDWIMPRLDPDVPFWGKPPLWFWVTSASFKIFGLNEFAARFGSWIFTLLAAGAAMSLAARFHGRTTGLATGLVLSTCGLYFAMMGGVLTDPALLFGTTLTVVGFARCILGEERERFQWGLLFFAGVGLGVLGKGLIGIVLPGAGLGLWVVLSRRWRDLLHLPWLTGFALFFLIAVPWHLFAEWRSPGFLKYYIVGEHFLRYLDRGWKGDLYGNPHDEPKGMILIFGLISAMPWTLIAPVLLWRLRGGASVLRSNPLVGMMTCCFLGPLLFFCLSDNVIITYCLPMLPPFAVVMAILLRETMRAQAAEVAPIPSWLIVTPRRLVVATVAFSVLANVGWVLAMSSAGRKRSQHDLVQEFERVRADADDDLLYFRRMPYSAEFYSEGQARLIETDSEVRGQLDDTETDWIVVDDDDLSRFKKWSADARVHEVGVWGEHHVFADRR